MSSKKAKLFPPGTFIPTPQRLLAIMQLCIAFSLVCWYAAQPFMGEYFSLRSRLLIYEYAMGTSEILKKEPGQLDKLQRQAKRFNALPQAEKQLIIQDYKGIQSYAQRPVISKIGDGLRVLFLGIPPFELAWLVFSITIAILILLKADGAKQAAWLLPLIALTYAFDSRLAGVSSQQAPDVALFPREEFIVENYLDSPLKGNFFEQKAQLQQGWERYLIANWLPLSDAPSSWEQQVEQGEFAFTIARLQHLHGQPRAAWLNNFREKASYASLGLYLIWNLLFAWIMNRSPSFSTASPARLQKA